MAEMGRRWSSAETGCLRVGTHERADHRRNNQTGDCGDFSALDPRVFRYRELVIVARDCGLAAILPGEKCHRFTASRLSSTSVQISATPHKFYPHHAKQPVVFGDDSVRRTMSRSLAAVHFPGLVEVKQQGVERRFDVIKHCDIELCGARLPDEMGKDEDLNQVIDLRPVGVAVTETLQQKPGMK
jgi:hypothetical protein